MTIEAAFVMIFLMTTDSLTHRIAEVRSKMIHACERAGRDPNTVTLLLASKTVEEMRIREAFEIGCHTFGENKAQELLTKAPHLHDLPLEWHFIGQLQSNKVKSILPWVSLIHSVDRISLAEEIQKQAVLINRKVNVLIEINSSGEESKGGLAPSEALNFIQSLKPFSHLQVQGLMTMANDGTEAEVRQCFRTTRELLNTLQPHLSGSILSMGMSGDYELAIEEGATLIRVGSSVFGKRS